MKNKKTVYFLVPIVLAIWGMIGWKVYAAIGGREKDVSIPSAEKKIKISTGISDTLELIANYRDPFLDRMLERTNLPKQNSSQKAQKEKLLEVPKQELKWPKIIYHGLVKKSGSERTLGFLGVDGKSHFVKSGDDVGNLKVGKIWKDSVEVFWGREKVVFRK